MSSGSIYCIVVTDSINSIRPSLLLLFHGYRGNDDYQNCNVVRSMYDDCTLMHHVPLVHLLRLHFILLFSFYRQMFTHAQTTYPCSYAVGSISALH